MVDTATMGRPVAEFDATADRCLMLQLEHPDLCLNGHAIGDRLCEATHWRQPLPRVPSLFDAEEASPHG